MDNAQIDPKCLLECVRDMTRKQRSELASLLFDAEITQHRSDDLGDAVLCAMQANFRTAMLESEIARRDAAAMPPPVPFVMKNCTAAILPPADPRSFFPIGDGASQLYLLGIDVAEPIKQEPVWPSDAVRHVVSHADRAAFGVPADRTTIGPTTDAALVVHNGERRLLAVDPTRQYVTVTNDAHLEVRFDYGRPGAVEIAGQATINKIVRDWGGHKELRPTRLLSFCPDDRVRDYTPIAAAAVDTDGRLTVEFHPPGATGRSITLGAAPTAVRQELHHLKGWPTVDANYTTLTHLKRWRDDTAHNLPD